MKKKLLFTILFAIFAIILMGSSKCYAQDLDRITDYIVTVDPRMNDGTLDITYEIAWKVLDSTSEGPLEWVQIGTPNENFDTSTALTSNIKSISKYSGSYVKIVFDRKYYAGEEIRFKYRIHQSYMYNISWGKCKYSFTPAWFTDAKVDRLTIKWNQDQVKSSSSKSSKEENYLVWKKFNLNKGEKYTINIKYDKSAFSGLSETKQSKYANKSSSRSIEDTVNIIFFVVFIAIFILSIFFGGRGGGGYYGHRGFYGGGFYGGRMCTLKLCLCK